MSVYLIQQAIDYIEAHILEDINYLDAARSVGMSGYSFHRMFSFIVGITANEYIRYRRLALAGQELQAKGISVIEAAYKYGYESPESFSKAFSRFHGSSPKRAVQRGASLRLFSPLAIKITIGGGSAMEYRIEHREKQRFLVTARAFANEGLLDSQGKNIPQFWEECGQENRIEPMRELRPQGKRDLFGLCGPVKHSETHFDYGIGIILDEDTDQTEAEKLLASSWYSLWETSAADYAVFRCMGPDGECLGKAWDSFYKEFLPQTGYSQAEGADYEIYYEQGEKGLFCELFVPVEKK